MFLRPKYKYWTSKHGHISYLEFDKQPSFKDQYLAYGCIVVMTSNGKVGTLTHLGTEITEDSIRNPAFFAECLSHALGMEKENSLVIIAGGLPKKTESLELKKQIITELQRVGFTILEPPFLPGDPLCPRSSTLYRDKVVVSRSNSKFKLENTIEEYAFLTKEYKSYSLKKTIERSQSALCIPKMPDLLEQKKSPERPFRTPKLSENRLASIKKSTSFLQLIDPHITSEVAKLFPINDEEIAPIPEDEIDDASSGKSSPSPPSLFSPASISSVSSPDEDELVEEKEIDVKKNKSSLKTVTQQLSGHTIFKPEITLGLKKQSKSSPASRLEALRNLDLINQVENPLLIRSKSLPNTPRSQSGSS